MKYMHGNKDKKQTEEHKNKRILAIRGKKRSTEQKIRISDGHKGIKHSEDTRLKMSLAKTGEKHWNWKGGITLSIKEWDKLHPERKLIRKQRRRARQTGAGGEFSIKEWHDLKLKYNFMCLCCKKQEPFIKLTADHIIPIFYGGTSNINNIQPLCGSCNTRKYTKTIDYRIGFSSYLID